MPNQEKKVWVIIGYFGIFIFCSFQILIRLKGYVFLKIWMKTVEGNKVRYRVYCFSCNMFILASGSLRFMCSQNIFMKYPVNIGSFGLLVFCLFQIVIHLISCVIQNLHYHSKGNIFRYWGICFSCHLFLISSGSFCFTFPPYLLTKCPHNQEKGTDL